MEVSSQDIQAWKLQSSNIVFVRDEGIEVRPVLTITIHKQSTKSMIYGIYLM